MTYSFSTEAIFLAKLVFTHILVQKYSSGALVWNPNLTTEDMEPAFNIDWS
jgi:hypothetical protein